MHSTGWITPLPNSIESIDWLMILPLSGGDRVKGSPPPVVYDFQQLPLDRFRINKSAHLIRMAQRRIAAGEVTRIAYVLLTLRLVFLLHPVVNLLATLAAQLSQLIVRFVRSSSKREDYNRLSETRQICRCKLKVPKQCFRRGECVLRLKVNGSKMNAWTGCKFSIDCLYCLGQAAR